MKSLKTKSPSKALLTGLAALALSGAAFAQTPTITIYIAGANGDRATTNTAVGNILQGETFTGVSNGTVTGSNYAKFTGGTFTSAEFGTVQVNVKTSFQGAAAGIAQVAGSLPGYFLDDSSVADPTGNGAPRDPAVPQIAMSTNFQATTPFRETYNGHFYEDLSANDYQVSVVGLKWYGSVGFPGDNITPQTAQYLFGSGVIPLAFFTGSNADHDKLVFATGRNLDAGQRFVAQAESGIGIYGVVKHYKPTISGQQTDGATYKYGGQVDSQVLWPVETYSGVSSQFLGNGGQDTGKNLAPFLSATLTANAYKLGNTFPNATAGYYISYLTPQDGDNAATHGAVELKWNGVPYSTTNIAEGRYTFWTYEHLFYRSSLSGVEKAFADALRDQIKNVDAAVAGIFLNQVNVSRSGEGTIVKAKYF